ncbi:ATP-binding domain-containing protein [Streptosporangium sp. NPDC023615]|uniref:HelD family protein n=1 Tax=Streptosporangium sp. NPDC023615 TaxID=3154794 RepID=UPI0034455537
MTDAELDAGPDAGLDGGLDGERAYLAECEAAVGRMIDGARLNVVIGERVAGDRYSAERLGYDLRSLAKELEERPDGPPFFGRLDFGPASPDHAGQRYYIGRRHVSGGSGRQPLVIDWRAPVSAAFYRASAHDPRGVSVRRRFGWSRNPVALTGFEDEVLDTGEGRGERPGAAAGVASRIVAAEIERPRVGPMRDIVATIQPEQDELVRAALERSICVQGAPGTGKTAVGLHRAAYLLYTHRQRLSRAGVLILGPNRAFLGYIAAVLPALGEVDVEQTTVEGLLARGPLRGGTPGSSGTPGSPGSPDTPGDPGKNGEPEETATVKHDARMAEVLRRALYRRVTEPADGIAVPDGSHRWRVGAEEFRLVVAGALRETASYGVGRERVLSRVVALLLRQAETRGRNVNAAWARRMARAVNGHVDAVWPVVRPEEVLAEVLGDPAVLDEAADGILAPDERAALLWARPPRSFRSARWSAADLVLLDELSGLLERPRGHGHVVVDEAQDLSPMQCRAIARRSEHGSITVLGDLAQGTTPWAARTWEDQLAHLGRPEAELIALTTGFRVPAAVVAVANRLLEELAVDVPGTRSFRTDGRLTVHPASDPGEGAVAAVRAALDHEGSIAVIAADAALDALTAALTDALGAGGVEIASLGDGSSAGRVTAVPASMAKGLEYDHVVVVEPARIAETGARGPNLLYVALTRAVSRLDVVHTRPLPSWFPRSPESPGPSEAPESPGPSGSPDSPEPPEPPEAPGSAGSGHDAVATRHAPPR